jgi:DNA topoisomerase-1
MDLEKALMLLSLPRKVGDHPEDGEPVEAGIGRYGPYVKHGRIYANLPEVDEVFTVGMNRAVELIAAKAGGARRARRGGGPAQGTGRTSRRGRAGQRDERALRALREVGKSERDPAERS